MKRGFTLLEVMVSLAIFAIIWSACYSIIASNYNRVASGMETDQLINLTRFKLNDFIDQGYPKDLLETEWDHFTDEKDDSQIIYPDYRWKVTIEDTEPPEWVEGSEKDAERRRELGIVDPYRTITISVQRNLEGEFVGDVFELSYIMKPKSPEEDPQGNGPGGGDGQ